MRVSRAEAWCSRSSRLRCVLVKPMALCMDKRLKTLLQRLDKTKTEEEVKAVWAKHLHLDYNTSDDHDLYTPQVLFEFKYDRKLSNASQLAPVVAQLMYYLHRLKFAQSSKGIPQAWCAADRNEAVIGEVADWSDLYSDDGARFDWGLAQIPCS